MVFFSDQKCPFWYILEGHGMEVFGALHFHLVSFFAILVYFVAIWYVCGHLVHFPKVGFLRQEKSGNLASAANEARKFIIASFEGPIIRILF
jgi:hypothetical protein